MQPPARTRGRLSFCRAWLERAGCRNDNRRRGARAVAWIIESPSGADRAQNGISSSWMPLWLAPARLPPPLERDGA
jgi:hypothetical protein